MVLMQTLTFIKKTPYERVVFAVVVDSKSWKLIRTIVKLYSPCKAMH